MTTIVHLSDLHFGRLDEPVAEALVGYIAGLGADVVVVSGDLTQRAKPKQFADAMAYLARFHVPKVIVPGNHDVPLYAVWERFGSPLRRYRRHVGSLAPSHWSGGTDEQVVVAGVNTARPFVPIWRGFWKDGRLSAHSLKQVKAERSEQGLSVRVLVAHHPLFSPPPPARSQPPTLLRTPAADRELVSAGVDVVLGGHLHQCYSGIVSLRVPAQSGAPERKILSIQAGTATSTRRRHLADGTEVPNSFNTLMISENEICLTAHTFTSARWTAEKPCFFRRFPGGWEMRDGGKAASDR